MIRYPPGRLARRTGGITPTFVAIGTIADDTGSQVYSYPAGILTNDILLFILETGGADAAPAAPAGGWVEITNSPSEDLTGAGSGQTRLQVFWRRYDGTGT